MANMVVIQGFGGIADCEVIPISLDFIVQFIYGSSYACFIAFTDIQNTVTQ